MCILYKRGICKSPCEPSKKTHRPIPRCAAEKGVRYCSECEDFPCKLYDGMPIEVRVKPGKIMRMQWQPYSWAYVEMIRRRLKKESITYKFLI